MNIYSRRTFLHTIGLGTLAYTTPGAFAELVQTPPQTEGPFYPNKLPLDTDNDLLLRFFLGRLYYRLEMHDEALKILESIGERLAVSCWPASWVRFC